jgi:hypothetical protein
VHAPQRHPNVQGSLTTVTLTVATSAKGRDRALVALAANGPMHAGELRRTIGSDPHKT